MPATTLTDSRDLATLPDVARPDPTPVARPGPRDTAGQAAGEWLSFRVGPATYGVDLLKVREIRSDVSPMRIANAPVAYAGLMDLRGDIVPVFDLRHLLDADAAGHPICIVMSTAERLMGILVDGVDDVVALAATQVRPLPSRFGSGHGGHLLGIGVRAADDRADPAPDARHLQLLDVERLLGASGLISA